MQERKKKRVPPLPLRQKECLVAFMVIVRRNGGVSPSLEELALEMGVKKATAQGFVRVLLKKGFLEKQVGSYRSLSVAKAVTR
jgi:DNA-binding MarR family transcriptional regulator